MTKEQRIKDFLASVKAEYPNVGPGTLAYLQDAFDRGYQEGMRDEFINLTKKESLPFLAHRSGDKLLD